MSISVADTLSLPNCSLSDGVHAFSMKIGHRDYPTLGAASGADVRRGPVIKVDIHQALIEPRRDQPAADNRRLVNARFEKQLLFTVTKPCVWLDILDFLAAPKFWTALDLHRAGFVLLC